MPVIVVSVYLLSIIADAYFIISLDEIAQELHLPNNVAGASLMAMGSNIFHILVGLGLPWLLAMAMGSGAIAIDTAGLMTSALLLFGTVILLFIFLLTNLKLSRWEGWALLAIYAGYVAYIWLANG